MLRSRYENATTNLFWVSCAINCARGTRTQPLICVEWSVHYWVPFAIDKGGFLKIAFVVVVDTPWGFEALADVLPHFDELTHVVIRASSSVCRGLLFCLGKAFIFQKFAESSYSVNISRVCWRSTIDLSLLNLWKRSSLKSFGGRCPTK